MKLNEIYGTRGDEHGVAASAAQRMINDWLRDEGFRSWLQDHGLDVSDIARAHVFKVHDLWDEYQAGRNL